MLSKKKINIEKDTISYKILKEAINSWFREHKQQIGDEFLVSPKKMKELQAQFQQKCLQYVILRRMPWIIKDIEQSQLIILNTELKRYYQTLLLNTFFKSQNTFQVFIFYLVKLVARFLEYFFSNLLIDTTLESEICIVLYFIFLGIEIQQKAYEIIKRKYENSLTIMRNTRFEDRSIKTSKNNLYESYLKQSMKTTSKSKFQRRINSINSIASICRPLKQSFYKDSIDVISQALQQHLHVNPLPPFKQRRIKIRQLQKMKTQPVGQQSLQRKFVNKKIGDSQQKMLKKSYFLSNQLSNSLKTLHPQQFYFQLASKQVKITKSFREFKSLYMNESPQLLHKRRALKKKTIYRGQNQSKTQLKTGDEWMNIIEDLKKKVYQIKSTSNETKISSKQQKQSDKIQPIVQTTNDRCKYVGSNSSEQNFEQLTKHKLQTSFRKMKIRQSNSAKVNNYQKVQDISIELIEPLPSQSDKKKKKTRKSLRCDQATFQNQCKARQATFLLEKQNQSLYQQWRRHFQRS